jgi:hypothetical protein
MEKLNYELVGKKATIECLVSGEINPSELSNFYILDVDNQSITSLDEATTEEVFEAINNPEVLFVQSVDHEYEEDDEDDDWDDEEEYTPKKKVIKKRKG